MFSITVLPHRWTSAGTLPLFYTPPSSDTTMRQLCSSKPASMGLDVVLSSHSVTCISMGSRIRAVLDISQKATMLSQGWAIAGPLNTPRSFAPLLCSLRNIASDVRPIDALAASAETRNHSPKHKPAVQPCDPGCCWYCTGDVIYDVKNSNERNTNNTSRGLS